MSRSLSLYRIVEDSGSRLVLEGRRVGLWLLTLFLLANAFILLWVGLFVVGRRHLVLVIAGSVLGLFFAGCGVATLWLAVRHRSRIEVDRDERMVRFHDGSSGSPREIPFAEIASIEIERERRRGPGGRSSIEHRIFLHDTGDGEWLIDRSTDGDRMTALRDRLQALTAAPDRATRRRQSDDGPRTAADSGPPPAGISIEPEGEATVYRWRTLPRSPLWALFWGFLTLMLGGATAVVLVATVAEIGRLPPRMTLALGALAVLALALMYVVARRLERGGTLALGLAFAALLLANLLLDFQPFIRAVAGATLLAFLTSLCAFVLLARCRLRISPAGLDYEERVLSLPLGWRRRSLPAARVEGFEIRAAVRGGGAIAVRAAGKDRFTLAIPQGGGAFSRRELEWLRRQWLEDLRGRPR